MKWFAKKTKTEEKARIDFDSWYNGNMKNWKEDLGQMSYFVKLQQHLLAGKKLSQKSVDEIWSLIKIAMADAYTAGQYSMS